MCKGKGTIEQQMNSLRLFVWVIKKTLHQQSYALRTVIKGNDDQWSALNLKSPVAVEFNTVTVSYGGVHSKRSLQEACCVVYHISDTVSKIGWVRQKDEIFMAEESLQTEAQYVWRPGVCSASLLTQKWKRPIYRIYQFLGGRVGVCCVIKGSPADQISAELWRTLQSSPTFPLDATRGRRGLTLFIHLRLCHLGYFNQWKTHASESETLVALTNSQTEHGWKNCQGNENRSLPHFCANL